MTTRYCDPEHVYEFAATRGSLVYPARAVASVNTTSNTMELAGHGFRTDAPLEFRAFYGGTLPSPIAAQTVYYAKPVADSDSLFQVAASAGGAAIDLSSAGENFGVILNVRETILTNIEAASEDLHQDIPAHAVPLVVDGNGNYPPSAVRIVAIRTAIRVFEVLGQRLDWADTRIELKDQLTLLRSGLRLRNSNDTSASSNLARGRSVTLERSDTIP